MNIAFFGSSLLSAYWNGAATYYRGLIKALSERGHHTTFYEPDAYDRQAHRDLDPPSWADVVVYPNDPNAALEQVQIARNADLIVKASGVGVFDELLEEAVLEQKRPNTIVAFWDVDAPATLERVSRKKNDPFRDLIPRYDYIFTYGGGEPVVTHYTALGARQCVPIYNALDPSTHFPVEFQERYRADLLFLGNRLPDREARVDEFFFSTAERCPDLQFLLGGSGWENKAMPANVRYLGHVGTAEHNVLNCSARAVLNISRASMARYGFSPATRIFEAAGAGACIITDDWVGVDRFFNPNLELLVARDGARVATHLSMLSAESARRIGRRAHARAHAEHSYANRAATLERALGISTRPTPINPTFAESLQ